LVEAEPAPKATEPDQRIDTRQVAKPTMTIIDACADPAVFAKSFKDSETWGTWFVFLRVLFGLPLSNDELATYTKYTGRTDVPANGFFEAWLICGRRAGKSLILALSAVYLAAFVDWAPFLTLGERGTIMVIAQDRRQARAIFRYIAALVHEVPMLAALIERETADSIDLSNGVTIEILTASFRSVRGYTLVAALCDEMAIWRSDEAANPDTEILAALRPAMATIPGARLLCASSPFAKKGALWDAYKRYYGQAGARALVWKATTREMNPTVPQWVIDEAVQGDPDRFRAEYLAEWRSDIAEFVSREVVEACVEAGTFERPPIYGISYTAFVDPSGGSSDSMTLCIAHRQDGRVVIDALREHRPPFDPSVVVADHAALLKRYNIRRVTGDSYAAEWPRERYREHGIQYEVCEHTRNDLYLILLPELNGKKVALLDNKRLVAQLCNLERKTSRAGRDSIDHPTGQHDDLPNCVAGAVALLVNRPTPSHYRRINWIAGRDSI
jgi:hypothetical protein